jgi:biopolymer transport protein TolR
MAMGPILGQERRKRRTPMAEINVTPMVDVMLVLLIIFMVSAPLLTTGVRSICPTARRWRSSRTMSCGDFTDATGQFNDDAPVGLRLADRRRQPRGRAVRALPARRLRASITGRVDRDGRINYAGLRRVAGHNQPGRRANGPGGGKGLASPWQAINALLAALTWASPDRDRPAFAAAMESPTTSP